jgi:glycosidase
MVDRFADGSANLADVVPGHPRRFQGGDLAGLRARLPYLERLGITHLWITPVAQQVAGLVGDGDDATAAYHGYWPADLRGVDPHFGTPDDLRALVDDARTRGIGIVLDVVVNHFGYGAADPDGLLRTRCGDDERTNCLFGLPDLRTEDPEVSAAIVDRTVALASDVGIAGFRIDAIKHVDAALPVALRRAARAARPDFFTIGEHWGASPGDPVVDALVTGGAVDGVLDFSFFGLARDWLQGRMRTAAFVHHLQKRDAALAAGPPMLAFLDNHDVETWAHAVGAARAPLGAPLLLLDRAVPVITWGTEVGRVGGAGDPTNRTFQPWADVAAAEQDPASSLHLWRGLVALRRRHEVLQHGRLAVVAADNHRDVEGSASLDHGFVVLERALSWKRAFTAIARGRRLAVALPVAPDAEVVDVVASAGGAARLVGSTLAMTVPADGSVTVVVHARAPAAHRSPE